MRGPIWRPQVTAPDFTVVDIQGNSHSLYAHQGKIAIVQIAATAVLEFAREPHATCAPQRRAERRRRRRVSRLHKAIMAPIASAANATPQRAFLPGMSLKANTPTNVAKTMTLKLSVGTTMLR